MEVLQQSISHTPIWVYVLFVYLISRGLKALRPGEVPLGKLAMIPGIFMMVGIGTLATRFGLTASVYIIWLAAIAAGAGAGWMLLSRKDILVDRSRGVIFRPADYTVLPLILASFAIKYAFGAVGFLDPELVHQASFGMIQGAMYGFFSGIFVGKFANYTMRYLHEPLVDLSAVRRGA